MKITVSGSFNTYLDKIYAIVKLLQKQGHEVLSPLDGRIVDCKGPFLFIESNKTRDIRVVEDEVLKAIKESDFLWIVVGDYNNNRIGRSTSFAIGYAVANDIPVYTGGHIPDPMLQEYVKRVENIDYALAENVKVPVAKLKRDIAYERGLKDAASKLSKHTYPQLLERDLLRIIGVK